MTAEQRIEELEQRLLYLWTENQDLRTYIEELKLRLTARDRASVWKIMHEEAR
jgi:regulator of replication initiation timing